MAHHRAEPGSTSSLLMRMWLIIAGSAIVFMSSGLCRPAAFSV